MNSKKVAIITRTKDRPIFLSRALQSIGHQSYEDYVHVIVNDGGDIAAIENLVDALPKKQKERTRVFHRDTPSGAPDTIFNESIDRVDSEYVVIHDDDDTWHRDFLERTVSHLDENGAIGGVVVRADRVVEQLEDGVIKTIKTTQWMEDMKAVSLYRQCIDNQLTPIAFLFRREAYESVGKFDTTLPVVGDWEFGLRLLQKYDIDLIDPGFALAHYHHRKYKPGGEGNTSYAGNDKHRYYVNKVMNKYLREELAEGRLGVGYIMSKLKYNEAQIAKITSSILPAKLVSKLKQRYSR